MTRAFCFALALLGPALYAACSSSSSSPQGGGPADAGVDGANCVAPGSTGNTQGIGAYCSVDAGCPEVPDASLICTAAVSVTPPNAHFCTAICTQDSDCGPGSYCSHQPAFNTSACIPLSCQYLDKEGGAF
jgi:hypothetical protein